LEHEARAGLKDELARRGGRELSRQEATGGVGALERVWL
jgi:hypothetical protein